MDDDLEKAIDAVGRERVFQRARAIGWRYGDDPPKWVWWGIVAEMRALTTADPGQPVTNGVREVGS